MMDRWLPRHTAQVWTVLLVLIFGAQAGYAQSLGDVARREEERRKQVKSGRVFTNADLAPVDPALPPETPPATVPAAAEGESIPAASPNGERKAGDEQAAPAMPKAREKRDEQYWRTRARDLRARLAKVNADVTATESRLRELDEAPALPEVTRERAVTVAALARLQAEARYRLDELTQFEARARAANVPPDWTR